jgi:uncharacterized protein
MTQSFGAAPDGNEIRSDERLISLFAHLSLFLGGILLPIIFWATNKDKSKFITFHSLQALWFHVAYIVVIIVLAVVMAVFAVIFGVGMGMMSGSPGGGNEMPVLLIIVMIAFYVALFAVIFGAIAYSIYMGVKAYQGNLVKYPIIGKMVYKKVYGGSN